MHHALHVLDTPEYDHIFIHSFTPVARETPTQ